MAEENRACEEEKISEDHACILQAVSESTLEDDDSDGDDFVADFKNYNQN